MITAPKIDRLLRWFDRGHRNPSPSTPRLNAAMEPLFDTLSSLAPLPSNEEAKELWLAIPRGSIEDYDSYEDMLEWEVVADREEYEQRWREDYPDPICWYRLVIVESFKKDGSLRFRAIACNDNTIISSMMDEPYAKAGYAEDAAVELCALLTDAATEAMKKLRNGTYNAEMDALLPYRFRTGVVRRSVLWTYDPDWKAHDTEGLSEETISAFKELLSSRCNDELAIGRLDRMTANDFFRACAVGYKACGYTNTDLPPVDQYFSHADGRDEGLSGRGYGLNAGPGIDFDDPDAWDSWYFDRQRGGGHPWEVCAGGNSTHVDLFVCHDRNTLSWKVQIGKLTEEQAKQHPCGFFFRVAGKHRPMEAVSFYVALHNEGYPVVLEDAREILARFEGTDYVGIVPHSVIPKYCEGMFPAKYGRVIDFMNVYDEEIELYGSQIEWLPLEEAKLK